MTIPKIVTGSLNIFFPSLIFRYTISEKRLFLTFDDGPSPGVTDFVLNHLDEYGAKATFFCLGENVEANLKLYERIVLAGHQTANHGWEHSDAFRVSNSKYLMDIERTEELIGGKTYRPPYGRLWPRQIRTISKDYQIIMWNIMLPDYKANLDCEKAVAGIFPKITAGSIIVMHDSIKASEQVQVILPRLLREFTSKGYRFDSIPPFISREGNKAL